MFFYIYDKIFLELESMLMKNRRGFTLIEIIAVVIIIGILALIIVPSVSSYIVNSRNTAYKAHEKTMAEAAKSMTVETINGNDHFELPKKGEQNTVYLSELIEREYTAKLEDPATGKLCNAEMSHVIIEGEGNSSFNYISCLYCGNYITDNPLCDEGPSGGDTDIQCGTVTGDSTTWTGQSRTISVACVGSNCKQSKFSKTFSSTTKEGTILIKDKKGTTKACTVNAYVDKNPPTCELEVVGDENVETTGWSSGREVTIKFVSGSRKDIETGEVDSYGMGTSSKNRNYNKQESYRIENISGTTTVMGYVKDASGNEGICYKTVKTGLAKPDFDVRYGYQIYPDKERINLTDVTKNGNKFSTTSDNPTIEFTNMDKYTNVTAVIVVLKTVVNDPKEWKLTAGGNTYSADGETTKRLKFHIETEPTLDNLSSSSSYTIKLGNKSGRQYEIERIEIERVNGDLIANRHQVSVNLITRKEVVKTTAWSWDNGVTYSYSGYYKRFTPAVSNYAKIKNDIPLESDAKYYSVIAGDTTGASISFVQDPDKNTWTNDKVKITATATDDGTGIVGYAWSRNSSIDYYDTAWHYYDSPQTTIVQETTVEKNGKQYLFVKDDSGNVSSNYIDITNIDKNPPTCNAISGNGNNAVIKCSDPEKNTDYGQSKIVSYYFGTNSSPSDSNFVGVAEDATYEKTETVPDGGTYYVFVKDKAGNKSAVKSDTYYTVTFNGNGATTDGSASGIVRYKSKSISKITNPKREHTVAFDLNGTDATATTTTLTATYTLNGWYSASSGGSKVASNSTTPALQASVSGYTNKNSQWTKTDGATLYAQWTSGSVKLPAVSKSCYTCSWNTNKSGTGNSYAGGKSFTPSSNTTLYATCSYAQITCGKGTYLPASSCSCKQCEAGYYCPGGNYTAYQTNVQGRNSCATGYRSDAGASKCIRCDGWTGSGASWRYISNGEFITGNDGLDRYDVNGNRIAGKYIQTSSSIFSDTCDPGGGEIMYYYIKNDGYMFTGWLKSGGRWYYLEERDTNYNHMADGNLITDKCADIPNGSGGTTKWCFDIGGACYSKNGEASNCD
jgi:prepilin-type N-terminal cleavage/methylation domain-containing protein